MPRIYVDGANPGSGGGSVDQVWQTTDITRLPHLSMGSASIYDSSNNEYLITSNLFWQDLAENGLYKNILSNDVWETLFIEGSGYIGSIISCYAAANTSIEITIDDAVK